MRKFVMLTATAVAVTALAVSGASAHKKKHHNHNPKPLPTCEQLGTDSDYGLVGNPKVVALSVELVPADEDPGYCEVNLTYSGEAGKKHGYRSDQAEMIRVRVGLPLSEADGGTGGVQGAWNGNNRDNGGGGYAGGVGGVTSATDAGYVGTSTDTGHDGSVQPGGSFGLNPDGSLNWGQIEDFSRDGIRQQHLWGVKLAKTYYGKDPKYKYWNGCSTGGRQGHYQAQNFPDAYDGLLAGAPAFNWDRFIPSELWPQIVMKDIVGGPISGAKLSAVSNAAIAACDGNDGVVDGMLEDPRTCDYDAQSFVCTGDASDPADCLSEDEAEAVNKIWDGPVLEDKGHPGWKPWHRFKHRHKKKDINGRAWYGLEPGTPLFFLAGGNPFSIATDHFRYWLKRDPAFDWHTVTMESFFKDFVQSVKEFNHVIGTDDDLKSFRKAGGKMITYHGLFDPLIFPRGTYNYYNRVSGSNKDKQKYYRYFPYPNAGHCGGAGLNSNQLFDALVDWVEKGNAPDELVIQVNATRTRKACMYPNTQAYNGSGSTDDAANFTCVKHKNDDKDLLEADELDKKFEPRFENRKGEWADNDKKHKWSSKW